MRRVIATALFVLVHLAALGREPWQEESRLVAAVPKESVQTAVAAVDAALAPLGFRRDPSAYLHPTILVQGLLVAYVASTNTLASLHEGPQGGCLKLFVENYERVRIGSADVARASVEKQLRKSLGNSVRFYSDVECKHAL